MLLSSGILFPSLALRRGAELLAHPVVALVLELQRQILAAAGHYSTVQHDMNVVRLDVAQDPLVVRDDDGAAQEVSHRDPGHLARLLEGEEHAEPRPLVGLELQDVLAEELDGAVRDLVARVAHEHVRERALARPVRAHDGVYLALAHLETEALEDLAALDLDVQVVYL